MTRSTVSTQSYSSTGSGVTFVNNELITGFVTIANRAGADSDWIVQRREKLTESLSTWLEEESLSKVRLELRRQSGTVVEAFVFDVSYDGDHGFIRFPGDSVSRAIQKYRDQDLWAVVVPVTYTCSTDLDGWSSSRNPSVDTRSIDSFGADNIDIEVGRVVDSSEL